MAKAAALVALVLVMSSCGRQPSASKPSTELFTTVAQARVPRVEVFDEPTGGHARLALQNPNPDGAPLVFVVRNAAARRIQVELPVRPNGSLGWISSNAVRLTKHDYRIVIELALHEITVWHGASLVDRERIGVGTQATPTPGGSYFTTGLIRPPDPHGFYGPYVYTLSGYSEALQKFAGTDAVIGIHGTNEPWGIGQNVSHGCIRMSNRGISRLAHLLPLGVPVDIQP